MCKLYWTHWAYESTRCKRALTKDQMPQAKHVIIIGAGVGGLATAMRLAAMGLRVTVFEAASSAGGKMRTLPTVAGPVDAGPTVFTLKWVFEDLFAACDTPLSDHVTLTQSHLLARHFWSDGSILDLCDDTETNRSNLRRLFGQQSVQDFDAFGRRAQTLFEGFDQPMMRTAIPSTRAMIRTVLRQPRLIAAMAPHKSLASLLHNSFREPKLRQLFGRYATYVGGSPFASPALLSLIWHAERSGVWAIEGGMNMLARAMQSVAEAKGARFHFDCNVTEISQTATGVGVTVDGAVHHADSVVFNGDPRALAQGLLGPASAPAVPLSASEPRSLSACVYAFAAEPSRDDLAHHNVFFGDDPHAEFGPMAKGRLPDDPTLYVCAQDRGGGQRPRTAERFEIIMNAPPATTAQRQPERVSQCQTLILGRLSRMGLTFSPAPTCEALTLPEDFNRLFPASQGSLYGRSPHGMTAALKRPTARTRIKGLYLAGGGAHPGAGVPMTALSGLHAAEAIAADLGLI